MPDRIAVDLLRASLRAGGMRDAGRAGDDRLAGPAHVAVGLRAALFADLVLAGSLGTTATAPVALGPDPADPILGTLHRAVARRRGVAWRRWYRHVDVDLDALARELVGAGRWVDLGRALGGHAYRDAHPDSARRLRERAVAVGRGDLEPSDPRDAVLGVLIVATGAGSGSPAPAETVPLVPVVEGAAELDADQRRALLLAVGTAQNVLRRGGSRVGGLRRRALGG